MLLAHPIAGLRAGTSGFKEWELSRVLTQERGPLKEMAKFLGIQLWEVEQGTGSCQAPDAWPASPFLGSLRLLSGCSLCGCFFSDLSVDSRVT